MARRYIKIFTSLKDRAEPEISFLAFDSDDFTDDDLDVLAMEEAVEIAETEFTESHSPLDYASTLDYNKDLHSYLAAAEGWWQECSKDEFTAWMDGTNIQPVDKQFDFSKNFYYTIYTKLKKLKLKRKII